MSLRNLILINLQNEQSNILLIVLIVEKEIGVT